MKFATNLPKHMVVGSRGGRLIKWRGTVASMAPGLVAALVAISSDGMGAASAETVSVFETRNTKQEVTVDSDWIVASTGSIVVNGTSPATAVEFAAGTDESGYIGSFLTDGPISSTAVNAAGRADATALSFLGYVGEYVKDNNYEIVTATKAH